MIQHKNQYNGPAEGEASSLDPRQLYEAITAQSMYQVDSVPVIPTGESFFTFEKAMTPGITRVLGEKGDVKDTVQQELRAVVKAGDDLFGVVKVDVGTLDGGEFLLTKFDQEGERASVVGVIPAWLPAVSPDGLRVGRTHQEGLSYNTSRDHFSIGKMGNRLLIVDHGSTNGTKVIRTRSSTGQETQISQPVHRSGVLGHMKRRAAQRRQQHPSIPVNPLIEHGLWSPESAVAKEYVMGYLPTSSRHVTQKVS